MNWFEQDPTKKKNIVEGLNQKYGNFDFTKSSRSLAKKEFKKVLNEKTKFEGKKIINVGGNDGHEIMYLIGKPKEFFTVDLAKDALKKVKGSIPIFASAEVLPFIDSYFDRYLAFRTLFSKHVSLEKCIREAGRILKNNGTMVISIPNGYLVDGKIEQGMFSYETSTIDKGLPMKILKKSLPVLKKNNFTKIYWKETPSEILIFSKISK